MENETGLLQNLGFATVPLLVPVPCCGALHLRRRRCAFPSCRPLPLARLLPPAAGGSRLAPRALTFGSRSRHKEKQRSIGALLFLGIMCNFDRIKRLHPEVQVGALSVVPGYTLTLDFISYNGIAI